MSNWRVVVIGAIMIVGAACGRGADSTPAGPCDVLLITVDALRADSVGFLSGGVGTSPFLDSVAAESVVFTQTIASSSGTTASMASMMTGRYPNFETVTEWKPSTWYGFADLASEQEKDKRGLTSNVLTLAESFAAAGYQTVGFHTNPNLSKVNNMHQGFEEYHQFEPWLDRVKKERVHRMEGHYPPAPVVVSAVLQWLESGRDERPVFLWLHLMEPHSPYLPDLEPGSGAQQDSDLNDADLNDVYYNLLFDQRGAARKAAEYPSPDDVGLSKEAVVERAHELYRGEVRFFDREFERLVSGLRVRNLWRDATVMITADHGEEFLDHGFVGHHFQSAMAEELIHVPLLVKPAHGHRFEPGRRIDAVTRMVDFAPTLLDYAGVDAAPNIDGASLRALVEDRTDPPRMAFLSTLQWGIARDGRWKYRLEKPNRRVPEARERLFDIVTDPLETNDVAAANPRVLERMRGAYRDFSNSLADRVGGDSSGVAGGAGSLSDDERARLEALGYVEQDQ